MPRWVSRWGRKSSVGRSHRPPRCRRLRRWGNRRRKVPTTAVIAGPRGAGQTARRAPATRPPGRNVADRPQRIPTIPPLCLTRHSTLRRWHWEARRWVERNTLPYAFPARHHALRTPVGREFMRPRTPISGPVTAATARGTSTVRPRDSRAGSGRRLLAGRKGRGAPCWEQSRLPKPPGVHSSHPQSRTTIGRQRENNGTR